MTLQAHLGAAIAGRARRAAIAQAVALIATLQRRGAELASRAYLPYGIAFDVEKLTWELEFFTKHFLEAYRGVVIAPASARRRCARSSAALVARARRRAARALPSRLPQPQPDAAPATGSTSSTSRTRAWGRTPTTWCRCCATPTSICPSTTVERADRLLPRAQGPPGREAEFRERFDLMALQRNLKALGTFGYQTTARRNPVYIQYIPRTLRYVRDNLAHLPRFARLRSCWRPTSRNSGRRSRRALGFQAGRRIRA